MNFVIKSTRLPVGRRPIHLRKLSQLLADFGIPKVRGKYGGNFATFSKHVRRSLWDIWELVRARWKNLRRRLHPDKTGKGHERFAVMSAIHDTILKRLKRKGICA